MRVMKGVAVALFAVFVVVGMWATVANVWELGKDLAFLHRSRIYAEQQQLLQQQQQPSRQSPPPRATPVPEPEK